MMKYALLILLMFFPHLAGAELLIGGKTSYTVKKGDTIERIGSRLGVPWTNIVRENGLAIKKPIKPGQELTVNTRKIVPVVISDGIIINIPDRMLYFFKENRLEFLFPVGLGKPPQRGSRDWSTPVDTFKVLHKEKKPSWYVPESIQAEMRESGKPVETIVPPGPDNPLGEYALKTSLPGILIHATIWPGSVYQYRSHGCIRVTPEHMEKFFYEVELNTPGELLYMPVKVAVTDDGKVFLEVHRDVYGKVRDMKTEVKGLLEKKNVSHRVDWEKVERVIREKSGLAEEITL